MAAVPAVYDGVAVRTTNRRTAPGSFPKARSARRFRDVSTGSDYIGAALVCSEVGVDVVDASGRDLTTLEFEARRTPVAGPHPLLTELLAMRSALTSRLQS